MKRSIPTDSNEATGSAAAETPPSRIADYVRTFAGTRQAAGVMDDLRNLDFKSEIVPIDQHVLSLLKKDFVFWVVAALALVPLVLVTFTNQDAQLTGFCLFFAAIWGVIFKKFVLEDDGGWRLPMAAFFFTGLVGIPILLMVTRYLPDFYRRLPGNSNAVVAAIGHVVQTGICEELCKIVPVLLYIAWKRGASRPMTIVLIGVFSGLGFAAFENLIYVERIVDGAAIRVVLGGAPGFEKGVKDAMVAYMLRSMSSVFGHAIYSGIFSYFIALGLLTGRRRIALFLVGLVVAACIHGLYNGFLRIQPTFSAIVTAIAFMLFYSYLTKLRLLLAAMQPEPATNRVPATVSSTA